MENPKQPHAVLVPFPAQGHLIPLMQLASLLQTRGFFVTFVNTEFNHRRLLRSRGPEWMRSFGDSFRFETIADGLPPSDRDAMQDPVALCDSIRRTATPVFRELVARLVGDAGLPRISCIVSDGVMGFTIGVGAEFGIPVVQLWTASACGFMGYLQYPELIRRGMVPFKDENFAEKGLLETQLDWIPGMKLNMRMKDMPTFIRTTDINDVLLNYLKDEAQSCLKASAIIFNTFHDLEHEVLEAIAKISPPTYTIGPLSLLSQAPGIPFRPTLWKDDRRCLDWLDKQAENSVVYINYGSITLVSEHHLTEFAWGLANSKYPFLWVVRPDVAMGEGAVLPEEFVEETRERGLIVKWCPQEEVLGHAAVGVFLTHCGWNSVLESVGAGVPMMCWPFFAEQQTNCRYVCGEWGVGVEVESDVRREGIEELVREVMEGEKGREMKGRALEWRRKAEEAVGRGGVSCGDFDRLVDEILRRDY